MILIRKRLSISEMAEIHNISRQTLIYYDKIGLFKPEKVDENGYRYYSPFQIPFLREICFLKSVGIKLEDIKKHIKNRNLTTAISLLDYHQNFINKEIENLLSIQASIQNRLTTYSSVNHYKEELYRPVIEEFPERKAAFFPIKNKITRQELHLALMRGWNILMKQGIIPSAGFGTIIMTDCLDRKDIFDGAGAGIFIPLSTSDTDIEHIITLPAGKYACMYKYGMPYNTKFLHRLLGWISEHHYKITGNIADICILDNTFYDQDNYMELCQLQIPIEKI